MARQRLHWMDLVRGLCILLVVFLHCSAALKNVDLEVPAAFAVFNKALDPFRIPLLMFLSGMLLHKSLSKPNKDYVLGKFHLIFWPFLVWSMMIYAAEGRLTLEYILKTPISAPSLLWYLWFLCAYYLIALGLLRWRIPLIPVMLVCLVAAEFLPSLVRMDRFAALFAFFLLGHVVVTRAVTLQGRWPVALIGLAAAVTGAALSIAYGKIKYEPLFVWVPVGMILFVLWAAPAYESRRGGPVGSALEWIGRNSIVFYAAHFPIQLITVDLLVRTTTLPDAAVYMIAFVAAIAISAALQLLRGRYDLVAALFDFRKLPGLSRRRAASLPSSAGPQ